MSLTEMNYWFSEKEGATITKNKGETKMDTRELSFKVNFEKCVYESMEKWIAIIKEMAFDQRIDEEVRKEYIDDIFAALKSK